MYKLYDVTEVCKIVVDSNGIKESLLFVREDGSCYTLSHQNKKEFESYDDFVKAVGEKVKVIPRTERKIQSDVDNIDGYTVGSNKVVDITEEVDENGLRRFRKSESSSVWFYSGWWLTSNGERYELRETISTELYNEYKSNNAIKGPYIDKITADSDMNSLNRGM